MSRNLQRRPAVERLVRLVERIAAIMLGLVTVMIVLSSIGRYGFSRPLPDVFDLSRLLLGVAIAWGMASVAWHGTHIKVDLLAQALRPGARRWINALAWSVLLVFTAAMTWKIGARVLDAMSGGDTTMDLRLPHWPFFAALWAGLLAALATTTLRLWRIIRHGTDLGEFDGIDPDLIEERKP